MKDSGAGFLHRSFFLPGGRAPACGRRQCFAMKNEKTISILIYIFGPVFCFLIVVELVAAAMDYAWNLSLQKLLLQDTGAAFSYTIQTIWPILRLLPATAAGCLSVRREAQLELPAFAAAQKQRRLLYRNRRASPVPGKRSNSGETKRTEQYGVTVKNGLSGNSRFLYRFYAVSDERLRTRTGPLLLTSVILLALGINALFSCILPGTGSPQSLKGLSGPAGFKLQVLFYCFFMPLAEETVFRGILYPRLQSWYGTGAAILGSAAFFGIYHGALSQGIYAFLMGILFAAAYEAAGSFTVPCALHGACNLVILLLQWTDTYTGLCKPVWAAAFMGAAVCGFYTIDLIIKKTAE